MDNRRKIDPDKEAFDRLYMVYAACVYFAEPDHGILLGLPGAITQFINERLLRPGGKQFTRASVERCIQTLAQLGCIEIKNRIAGIKADGTHRYHGTIERLTGIEFNRALFSRTAINPIDDARRTLASLALLQRDLDQRHPSTN